MASAGTCLGPHPPSLLQFLRAEDLDSPYGQVRLRGLGTVQGWG